VNEKCEGEDLHDADRERQKKIKGRRSGAVGQTLCFRWEDKTKAFCRTLQFETAIYRCYQL